MNDRGVVVVGAGVRGSEWCAAIDERPGWRLVGVVDRDPRVLDLVSTRRPDVLTSTTLGDMLHSTAPQAVVVATPHDHHVEPCRTALAGGAAVLVEKPFTTSMADAQDLVREAADAGLPLLVAQNYRYLRWVRAARAIIEAGELGPIETVSMRYRRPWADLDVGRRSTDHSVVWEMSPHHIDHVRHLLGDEIAELRATISSSEPDRAPGATVRATGRTTLGVAIRYEATYEDGGWLQRIEGGRRFSMRIGGRDGTLLVLMRRLVLVPRRGMPRVVPRGDRAHTEEAAVLDELAGAIEGIRSSLDARDNLLTLAGVVALLTSAAQGGAPVAPLELLDA